MIKCLAKAKCTGVNLKNRNEISPSIRCFSLGRTHMEQMFCSIWGTDCSGRSFSALVVLVRVSYRILLTWTQSWKQEDAVANQQADFSLHVHRLWNLTSVFLVVVCPIIPDCSFSGSSSLCKLTSHTHSCIPTSRLVVVVVLTQKYVEAKPHNLDYFYRLNWMFCVSLLWSVIVKGCVVIIMSIVQHAAVHRQRCDAFGAFNGYCRLIFFARTPPNMEYCLLSCGVVQCKAE